MTNREMILKELDEFYLAKKFSYVSYMRIEMYTLTDRATYFVRTAVEEYDYDENFKGTVAVAYFNDGEVIPLVDQISIKLGQVSAEDNEFIVRKVNKLLEL